MDVHDQDAPERDDVQDLDQDDREDLVLVPVEVQGPVRTRELPRRRWVSRHYTLGAGAVMQLAGRELGRAIMRVWVVSWAGGGACPVVHLSESESVSWASDSGILPPVAGSVVELTHCDEVWVRNADAANAVVISVISELWAE